MGGFATSRPASIGLCAFLSFLNLFAFLFAVGAERRRSTGKVVPNEYDDCSYCLYETTTPTPPRFTASPPSLCSCSSRPLSSPPRGASASAPRSPPAAAPSPRSSSPEAEGL